MAQGLGRGLGSLIPKKTMTYGRNPYQAETDAELVMVNEQDQILQVDPALITINPQQPRTEFNEAALESLAKSIAEHGIISPLIVTKTETGGFELIAGERRWRAAQQLKLKEVPVIVRQEGEQKKLELALIENIQREDLNPLEIARAYQQLINDFNLTQEGAAERVGKARSSVANTLRLLTLPKEAQAALAGGKISEAHAKILLSLDNPVKQLALLKKIMRQNLTVAETDRVLKQGTESKGRADKSLTDRQTEAELEQYFGTKVEVRRQKRGGKLVIDFYSEEELDSILAKIK
ncbi:MAG: ParB/RepB/Spo0J family partition protein [Patescibacteria group bacterium]|jgi:ParB family chromosome partitioning protein